MRLGVLGYADHSGLGQMTESLIRHLGVQRHLAPSNKGKTKTWEHDLAPHTRRCNDWTPTPDDLDWFLSDVDLVLTVETDYGSHLAEAARIRGIKSILLPMWEYFGDPPVYPGYSLYIGVSKYGYGCIPADWPRQYLPWPIDTERFAFKLRGAGRITFLHAAGHTIQNNRKGTRQVLQAFSQAKDLDARLCLRSQVPLAQFPPDLIPLVAQDARISLVDTDLPTADAIYQDGDVFVFPSRLEGHALVTLEAMSCGMIPMTTDAAPMNEFDLPAECYLPADVVEQGHFHGMDYPKWEVDPRSLADRMRHMAGINLPCWSKILRSYVEAMYSWQALRSLWVRTLEDV